MILLDHCDGLSAVPDLMLVAVIVQFLSGLGLNRFNGISAAQLPTCFLGLYARHVGWAGLMVLLVFWWGGMGDPFWLMLLMFCFVEAPAGRGRSPLVLLFVGCWCKKNW